MPILSLEASTSSAKAMLYDPEHSILGVETVPYAPGVSDGATFEPDGIADAVLQCGSALLARFPGVRADAVGLSSNWHSLILLDGDNGPLGRGRTWADASAAPTAAEMRRDAELARRAYENTGCPLHITYNVCKWTHIRRTEDVSRVRRLSCLPEYLFFRLTGELATSVSAASGMGLLNTRTLDWDGEMLKVAGIQRDMLGQLVEPHYSLPLMADAAARLGLPAGTPIAACGPDGALNHIAAGGLGGDVMTFSVGTSAALRMRSRGPVIPKAQSTWCYYCAEGFHLAGAATAGAGNCVNWFVKDLMGGALSFAQLEAAAEAADPETLPYFLPFLFGERCPGWDDARLGGFRNIGPDSGTGALYRAVLEGILFNLYQNYLILVENIGRKPGMISISGGITKSKLWMRMAADIFGETLVENAGEHASLLGAAHMARRAVEQIASLAEIPAEEGRAHGADMGRHEEYMKRFHEWLEYYNTESGGS